MQFSIDGLNLVLDGSLPKDSLFGGRHRQVFCEAKPKIDYAFKVDRLAFVRCWWFDRQLEQVLDFGPFQLRPKRGVLYPVGALRAETDREIGYYLCELGWQVRVTMLSIDRLEFMVLVVFSAEGAILEENEEFLLKSVEAEDCWPSFDRELLSISA